MDTPNNSQEVLRQVVKPIPNGVKRGWQFYWTDTNGIKHLLEDFSLIEGYNAEKNLALTFGWVEDKYDAPVIREQGGGGNIIIPAVLINGRIHLGLNMMTRKGVSGFEFPRAMLSAGTTSMDIAMEEAANMCEKVTCDVQQIGGHYNANNAYMYTPGDGATYYLLKVEPHNVMGDKDGSHFIFRNTKSASPDAAKILACVFYPRNKVAKMVQSGEITDQYVGQALKIAEPHLTKKNLTK